MNTHASLKPSRLFKKMTVTDRTPTMPQKASVPSWYAGLQSYVQTPSKAVWSGRDYRKFAEEAYRRNVVANRAISMIAMGVANCSILAHQHHETMVEEITRHPLLHLLHHPNPLQGSYQFLESLVSYYLLAGDAFVLAVGIEGQPPQELHLLRPDRVQVLAGKHSIARGYIYKTEESENITLWIASQESHASCILSNSIL